MLATGDNQKRGGCERTGERDHDTAPADRKISRKHKARKNFRRELEQEGRGVNFTGRPGGRAGGVTQKSMARQRIAERGATGKNERIPLRPTRDQQSGEGLGMKAFRSDSGDEEQPPKDQGSGGEGNR